MCSPVLSKRVVVYLFSVVVPLLLDEAEKFGARVVYHRDHTSILLEGYTLESCFIIGKIR